MTKTGAELVVRDLVDRYGPESLAMPAPDLERLAEAIEVLGQARVFEIAEKQQRSR